LQADAADRRAGVKGQEAVLIFPRSRTRARRIELEVFCVAFRPFKKKRRVNANQILRQTTTLLK
jgi:hypothetical protein